MKMSTRLKIKKKVRPRVSFRWYKKEKPSVSLLCMLEIRDQNQILKIEIRGQILDIRYQRQRLEAGKRIKW